MPRVLVVTPEPIGEKMAGPAVRASHIARVLGESHDVVLASLDGASHSTILDQRVIGPDDIDPADFDAAIVQGSVLVRLPELAQSDLPLVVDWFDPFHLEALHRSGDDAIRRRDLIDGARRTIAEQARRGDLFLCSNQQQRQHWLGWLAQAGRINERTVAGDPMLESLLALSPFGTTDERLESGTPVRDVFDEIRDDDPLILWAGGLHDWLDPVTVVDAMPTVIERHPDARLVFLAGPHPNTSVESMGVRGDAITRARDMKLFGTHVLFATEWVDYDERLGWISDADLGVIAHDLHLETALSHRTRLIDHLSAGLATVSTEGDPLSAQLAAAGAASIVPAADPEALGTEIARLLGDEVQMEQMERSALSLASQFRWEETLRPLVEWMEAPKAAADREAGIVAGPAAVPAVVASAARAIERARLHLDDGGPKQVVERAINAGRRRLGR